MKLRWKYFLVLVAVSLVPLLTVTWISQNTSRRLGKTISEKARKSLTDRVTQEMVRSTRSYAAFSLLGGMATELAVKMLVAQAELAMALPPPKPSKIYYAPDFDDPRSAPPDAAVSENHQIRSGSGLDAYQRISRDYPNFLLAPGTPKTSVATDIARFTRLGDALKNLRQQYGEGLQWAYASLENGLHISYPGHGGYPPGYDPRKRPWYTMAKQTNALTWLPVVDATTRQPILTISMPFKRPDGTFAGVAAMDIKITHALVESETTSRWSQNMSSFIIGTKTAADPGKRDIWVISSQEKEPAENLHTAASGRSWRPEFEELFQYIQNRESGYLEMPYKGVDSIWAYAAMIADQYFVIVVPKAEIMTLPEEVGQMFVGYTKRQTAITGIAVILALMLVGILAFFSSRRSASQILNFIEAWKRVAGGDFSVRLKPTMRDERAQLVQAFNEMVPRIEEHMRMRHALGLAQEVQQSLLPQGDPLLSGFDIAGESIYCDETGGDYYDFIETEKDGRRGLAVVVGDVSGHGVSSALLMATARALIMLRSSMPGEAAGVISDVNRYLSLDTEQTGNFMTFFYCELTAQAKEVHWVRAGHEPALVYDPALDTFDELKGEGVALGLDGAFEYASFERCVEPGQIILIGTDGIWEMRNRAGEMFGKETLMQIVRDHRKGSARQIVEQVTTALEQFREDRAREDDVTLVVIKVGARGWPPQRKSSLKFVPD
jgi:sigma-B regulation protein RsbU (phosphoserine phosphatase)